MASSTQPRSLQIANRIHNTTGKENLIYICIGGITLESIWHGIVEKRLLNTPVPVVRRSIVRAALLWPAVFVVTKTALAWAEWRVQKDVDERRENKSIS
ncbi:uncharacterized protein GGS22DRAFT_169904 [Annulohypoxylon maeteangense]|uniref:uncharacterized protein n=1 Tax=Annulohypoxylon maeteangense TaxID=1927788 RepID=UPI002007705C|nr:uncharacterized protein GGS22DRAFT_169904 [Annulohypoxylon maeteangense]KAI0882621.1 hypothetical protein GGS22DRAFT_169904 [Annulohypoxylon maeteangense]